MVFILVLASVALSTQAAAPGVESPLGFLNINYLIAENVAGSTVCRHFERPPSLACL